MEESERQSILKQEIRELDELLGRATADRDAADAAIRRLKVTRDAIASEIDDGQLELELVD